MVVEIVETSPTQATYVHVDGDADMNVRKEAGTACGGDAHEAGHQEQRSIPRSSRTWW